MYETWVKNLIDIVDELAPVTLVRTRLDLPLGSVSGDISTLVHCRLDLMDEDSPWCDMEITQSGESVSIGYMIHIPNLNKRTDKEIETNVQSVSGVDTISLLTPVGRIGQETYVIKGNITAPLDHPFDNPNSATHDMAEQLVRLMQVGGYVPEKASTDDKVVDDELVTWGTQ
ncbi:MAG: hypothetical protein ACXVP5_03515 [Tumebacillaceae bacterium]